MRPLSTIESSWSLAPKAPPGSGAATRCAGRAGPQVPSAIHQPFCVKQPVTSTSRAALILWVLPGNHSHSMELRLILLRANALRCWRTVMQKLAVLVVTLAFSGSAYAADMASKAPPSPVAAASWTGFYAGAEAGGALSKNADSWTGNDPISIAVATGTNGTAGNQPLASPYNVNRNGVVGGIEFGYNWQFDPHWLLGFETDFSGSSIHGAGATSSLLGSAGGVTVFNNIKSTQDIDWYGTVRGRLGWLATPDQSMSCV